MAVAIHVQRIQRPSGADKVAGLGKVSLVAALDGHVLRQRVRWTDADVVELLNEIDDNGFQRGTIGQSVYHVLDLDRSFESRLPRIALNRALTDDVRRWAVVLFLYRAGLEAPSALEALLAEDRKLSSRDVLFLPWRDLHEIDHFEVITETVADFGQIDIF